MPQTTAVHQPSPTGKLRRKARKTRSSLRKTNVTFPGGLPPDRASFAFSFRLGLDILKQNQPQEWTQLVLGSWQRLLNSVESSGSYLEFIDSASYLRQLLMSYGNWSDVRINARFDKGRWVRGLVQAIDHSLEDRGQLAAVPCQQFDDLATFLAWLKRLPVQIPTEEESSDGFFRTDRRLSSVVFDDNPYLPGLRCIWEEWFKDFSLDHNFHPYHSSGSTADAGRIRHDKWVRTCVDTIASVCLRGRDLQPLLDGERRTFARMAKVAFVPKAAGKRRVICMEPASLQYLQHGVSDQIIAFASQYRHPLHRLVDIRSQDRNRELCARAYDERLATIDLSDASDSVSWRLIWALTKGMPLCRYLKGTRSVTTLVQGYRLVMDKFAPMGSALCFPIECYVFASVVELAYRIHTGHTGAGWHNGHSVYGDDIICPSEEYQLVRTILTSLGFVVNETKSFDSGPYYESCGVEYTYGWRVNTIRHPRNHLLVEGECSPERVGLVTDLANSLLELGYLKARRSLLKYYEELSVRVNEWKSVPFKSCLNWGAGGILSVNASCETEFIPSIQSRRHVYTGLRAVAAEADSDYQEWLSGARRRDREQRLRDLYPTIRTVEVQPRFSVKAVTLLSRMMPSILEDKSYEAAGSSHTGRLRWKTAKCQSLPVQMS